MSEVIFDEDKTILKPLPPEQKQPETGLEGWIYKILPGSYPFKKALLLGIVITMFAASFLFFALGRLNLQLDRETFEERADPKRI